jgi:hypothetical protein
MIARMTKTPFDHAALRRYIAAHDLTEPAMAAHAGIPYRTLRGILLSRREPLPTTRAAIERALQAQPPTKSLPGGKYDAVVRECWGRMPLAEIVERAGAKRRQDIQQVARRLGLPKLQSGRQAARAAE